MFLQVPLVIFLRPPEGGGRDDLRDHGFGETSRTSQPGHGILSGQALILIMIEYGGTVLAPHIDSLSVHLGRVMDAPKDIEKTIERNDLGIVTPARPPRRDRCYRCTPSYRWDGPRIPRYNLPGHLRPLAPYGTPPRRPRSIQRRIPPFSLHRSFAHHSRLEVACIS